MTEIKTIRGVKTYPTKSDYIAECRAIVRERLRAAQQDGYGLRDSSAHAEAAVAKAASEHYDMATVRGEDLRVPSQY